MNYEPVTYEEFLAVSTKSRKDLDELTESTKRLSNNADKSRKDLDELTTNTKRLEDLFASQSDSAARSSKAIEELTKSTKRLENLFTSQWGKLMEALVEGDLIKLLQDKGIEVYDVSANTKGCRDGQNYEFDLIAHNGKEIIIVEVKTTLRVKHIKHFINMLKKAKTLLPRYKNNTILGAIAFLKGDEESAVYAEKKGLYVLRAVGSSASIINAKNFKPVKF